MHARADGNSQPLARREALPGAGGARMTDEPEITLEAAPHVGAALLLKYNGSMTDDNLPGAMRPVSIYIGGGRTCVVSSLWAAAEVLFAWPGSKTCEHYKRA